MIAARAALALAVLLQPATQGAESPTQIVASVIRAVEHDSTAQATAAWSERLRRGPGDRPALLALAVLAERTYHFAHGDSLIDRLLAAHTPVDDWAAHGALEHAHTLLSRGLMAEADAAFTRAVARARAVRDSDAMFDGALGVAIAGARVTDVLAAARMLDSLGRHLPRDPRLQAAWRCERAALAARTGDSAAGPLASEGIDLARRAGDARLEGRCTWVLAQDYVREGNMGRAAEILQSTEAVLERARDDAALASVLQWHGYLEVSVGNFGLARELLERAVRLGQASGNLSALGWSYVDLSQLSYSMNDLADASRQAALAGSSFQVTRDTWGAATSLSLVAQVALDVGDAATARARYTELLGWSLREHNLLNAASARLGLADLAVRRGGWRTARRELDAQRDAYRRTGSAGWNQGLDFYYGVLALHRGDLAGAARHIRADLSTLVTSQHMRRYISRTTLAEVFLRQGDTTAAERELRNASAQLDAWRATLGDRELRLLAFQVRDAFGGRPPAIAALIAAIARSGRVDDAFALAERRRARELRDRLARAAGLRVTGDTSDHAPAPAERAIAVADVQRAIPNDSTAVLEYVAGAGGQPTTLFVLTRQGARAFVLTPLDSLRDAIERYGALLENGGDPRALALRLGDALLAPALAALPNGVAHLVIVPDDALWRVPFDAIALRSGGWLIERYTVATSPSAGVSVSLWHRPPPAGPTTLLAFGDPRFGGGDRGDQSNESGNDLALRSAATGPLPRLPGTAREVRDVARYFSDPTVRLRADASEAYLERTPLTGYRVIHFATHAIVDNTGTTRAGLALSAGGGADGFVSDGDLAALHLDADLVVLSACHTAGGTVLGGEGVRGLTAPLLQAGARSIVATEWPVDDARTVSMVDAFYGALARGLTTGAALRAAELQAMHDGAAPREWAAFRLVGDPTIRVPLHEPRGLFGWPWWR